MKKLFAIGMFIGGFALGGNLIAAETTTTVIVTPAQPATVTVTPAQPATVTTTAAQPEMVTTTPAQPATVIVTTEKKPEPQYHSLSNPFLCFGRGIVNVGTCWVEIPRCIVYDNAAIPFFGLIVGVPDGALFTVFRALAGVGDIITLGFIGDVYTKRYPDFVWESNWLPPKGDKE